MNKLVWLDFWNHGLNDDEILHDLSEWLAFHGLSRDTIFDPNWTDWLNFETDLLAYSKEYPKDEIWVDMSTDTETSTHTRIYLFTEGKKLVVEPVENLYAAVDRLEVIRYEA